VTTDQTPTTELPLSQRVVRRWYDIFEGEVAAWPIAFFRFILGASVLMEAVHNIDRLHLYTSGQYLVPYFSWIQGLDYDTLRQMCRIQVIFGTMIMVGIFSRVAIAGAFGVQGYLFLITQLNFRNHIYLMLIMLALTFFSRPDRVWSLAALLRLAVWQSLARIPALAPIRPWCERWIRPNTSWSRERISATPIRVIQAQVVFIYFYATIHKVVAGFHSGYPLCKNWRRYFRGSKLDQWVRDAQINFNPESLFLGEERIAWARTLWEGSSNEACETPIRFFVLSSVATIAAELLLTFGLLHRRTRWAAACTGIGMHGFIYFGMNVVTFGTMMVGTYVLFIGNPFDAVWSKWKSSKSSSPGEPSGSSNGGDSHSQGGDSKTAQKEDAAPKTESKDNAAAPPAPSKRRKERKRRKRKSS